LILLKNQFNFDVLLDYLNYSIFFLNYFIENDSENNINDNENEKIFEKNINLIIQKNYKENYQISNNNENLKNQDNFKKIIKNELIDFDLNKIQKFSSSHFSSLYKFIFHFSIFNICKNFSLKEILKKSNHSNIHLFFSSFYSIYHNTTYNPSCLSSFKVTPIQELLSDIIMTSFSNSIDNNPFFDIVLCPNDGSDKKFYLNKNVLSKYHFFHELFVNGFKESSQSEIVMEYPYHSLDKLLKLIYGYEINLENLSFDEILEIFHFLNMNYLSLDSKNLLFKLVYFIQNDTFVSIFNIYNDYYENDENNPFYSTFMEIYNHLLNHIQSSMDLFFILDLMNNDSVMLEFSDVLNSKFLSLCGDQTLDFFSPVLNYLIQNNFGVSVFLLFKSILLDSNHIDIVNFIILKLFHNVEK
jgi:hypothetical protein